MGILSNTREIKLDVLFRASEPTNGTSDWEAKTLDYLNRTYRALCTGVSEFLPEYIDDWWWMRGEGVLLLEPAYNTGSVFVTAGSPFITFSPAPATSLAGRRLRVVSEQDVPIIQSHTGGLGAATLDAAWTGASNAAAAFRAMKTDYNLSASVQAVMSPINIFQMPNLITGMSPERMDVLYPLALLDTGIPTGYALVTESSVRFSHGGTNNGTTLRLEYRYRPIVADLVDSISSIPLIPSQWMHILSDMALTYVLLDKNDDRSNAVALSARTNLAAMLKDNRRRNVKIDVGAGHIYARGHGRSIGSGRGRL